HFVEMIMQSVKLHDLVRIWVDDQPGDMQVTVRRDREGFLEESPYGYREVFPEKYPGNCLEKYSEQCLDRYPEKCLERYSQSVISNPADVPASKTNTVWKAATLFTEYLDKTGREGAIPPGRLNILLEKRIPVAAGLAGGSADAAAVLYGLNHLFDAKVDSATLSLLALQIGADVPFCLMGGTAFAEGIGEILTPLPSLPRFAIVLVKPPVIISTAWAYGQIDNAVIQDRPDTWLLLMAIKEGWFKELAGGMSNVFEYVSAKKYDIINQIKTGLLSYGASGSIMSGSGPTVFGIFFDEEKAWHAYNEFNKIDGFECFYTYTTEEGVMIRDGRKIVQSES
ncbi:MAG: 4-(cytidine 5'-diphospho)-2-C-methyl-D-erythritol kinase, partial [Clostridiales bacterium]|nr:4-(cytidine 5'-diphospho)-2-C-methyl-D-erythritol kinase [Clostridiales bacterium]